MTHFHCVVIGVTAFMIYLSIGYCLGTFFWKKIVTENGKMSKTWKTILWPITNGEKGSDPYSSPNIWRFNKEIYLILMSLFWPVRFVLNLLAWLIVGVVFLILFIANVIKP